MNARNGRRYLEKGAIEKIIFMNLKYHQLDLEVLIILGSFFFQIVKGGTLMRALSEAALGPLGE
jgi:hypothetical protein